MNDLTSPISVCAMKGLHLSAVIHAEGIVWRGGDLTDAQHVRAALATMCSEGFDKRFLDVAATDVASLALAHPAAGRPTPIRDWVLDDAVWQYACSRKHLYIELIQSISGRYVTLV